MTCNSRLTNVPASLLVVTRRRPFKILLAAHHDRRRANSGWRRRRALSAGPTQMRSSSSCWVSGVQLEKGLRERRGSTGQYGRGWCGSMGQPGWSHAGRDVPHGREAPLACMGCKEDPAVRSQPQFAPLDTGTSLQAHAAYYYMRVKGTMH